MIVGVVSQIRETRQNSKNAAAKRNPNNGFLERELSYQDKMGPSQEKNSTLAPNIGSKNTIRIYTNLLSLPLLSPQGYPRQLCPGKLKYFN